MERTTQWNELGWRLTQNAYIFKTNEPFVKLNSPEKLLIHGHDVNEGVDF